MLRKFKRIFLVRKQKERRKFVRLKAHHLLKYRVVGQEEPRLSFVRNISGGGLLFYAAEQIPVGSTLELIINFPSHLEPIKVISQVLRVRHLEKVGGYEIAAEFINIDEEARNFITKRVSIAYTLAKEGGAMKICAIIFLVLGVVGAMGGFLVRFFGANIAVAPLGWLSLTNTFLLFSIAISVFAIAHKK